MTGGRPTLSPNAISKYFTVDSCQMYLKWEYDDVAKRELHSRPWTTDDRSPVLMGEGVKFEYQQLDSLDSATYEFVGPEESDWDGYDRIVGGGRSIPEPDVERLLRESSGRDREEDVLVLHQPKLSGTVGAYSISGIADIIFATTHKGTIRILLAELKNSDERKIAHSYQAAIYASLVSQVAERAGIDCSLECVFATVVTQENSFSKGLGSIEEIQ